MMRLGKFEKWILINCYRKTVKNDLPPDWRTPRGYPRGRPSDWHDGYLFKSEVLLNYFHGLKISQKRSWFDDVIEKFVTTDEYRNALTIYRRTANSLWAKGLIKEYTSKEYTGQPGPHWTAIQLTDAGIEKAKQLLRLTAGL